MNEIKDLFYSEKNDWYTVDSDGVKNWNQSVEKTTLFWQKIIDEKINKHDLDFSNIHFPHFNEKNPFTLDYTNEKSFENIDFSNAVFYGKANFQHFNANDIDFSNTIFKDKLRFYSCHFQNFSFYNATAFKNAKFKSSHFQTSHFGNTNFYEDVLFDGIHFNERTDFSDTVFNKSTTFYGVYFRQEGVFYGTKFSLKSETSFDNIRVYNYEERTDGLLSFRRVVFPDKFYIIDSGTRNFSFHTSNIDTITFTSCLFNRKHSSGRIILKDELLLPKHKIDRQKFIKVEELYRQLKRNFASRNDWRNANDAFHSEMEMKYQYFKKTFFGNDHKWNIYTRVRSVRLISLPTMWFYRTFSLYTTSYIRPLFWLIIIILTLACLYSKKVDGMSNLTAINFSIANTLPVFKNNTKGFSDQLILISYIQKLFSTILIAFFILAVRKRFR